MFENDDFITWASENLVTAVGHEGATPGNKDHDPVDQVDPKTKEKHTVCPLYTGLTCEEHRAVRRSFENPPDGWGKIPEAKGVPNNCMVGPDGKAEKIDNKDALVVKSLIDTLTAFQKKFDKPIPFKRWDGYRKSFEEADKAVADGKWKVALAALAKVDADGKKLSAPLVEKVAARAKDLNEKVAAKFAEIRDGADDAAVKAKTIKALRADVGAKLSTGALTVVADLDAWIKDNGAPAAPPTTPPTK